MSQEFHIIDFGHYEQDDLYAFSATGLVFLRVWLRALLVRCPICNPNPVIIDMLKMIAIQEGKMNVC